MENLPKDPKKALKEIETLMNVHSKFRALVAKIADKADTNNDGVIQLSELKTFLKLFDESLASMSQNHIHWDQSTIDKLANDADLNKDKEIQKGELGILVTHLLKVQKELLEKKINP